MKRPTKMWMIATVVIVVVAVGGYIYAQYRSAQKPSLVNIPEYRLGTPYPIDDLPTEKRTSAEQTLRQFVSTVVSGYHIEDQRFLATQTPENNFVGDALRSEVAGFLNRTSRYEVARTHNPETGDIFFIAWRHSGSLQRLFNDDIIATAALDPVRAEPNAEQIHVYGYFKLVANRS